MDFKEVAAGLDEELKEVFAEYADIEPPTEDQIAENYADSEKKVDNEDEPPTMEEEAEPATPQEPEKPEFDVFLESLPNDAERAAAKQAVEAKWDFKRYNDGGLSYREWNARTPLIEEVKQQRQELREFRRLFNSTQRRALASRKALAERALKETEATLREAKEQEDFNTFYQASEHWDRAKKQVEELDEQLKEFSSDNAEPPAMSDERMRAFTEAANEFKRNNVAWWDPDMSPEYNPEKVELAYTLQTELLKKFPQADPKMFYALLQLELDKRTQKAPSNEGEAPLPPSTESTPKPAVRNPATFAIDATKSADNATTRAPLSEEQREALSLITTDPEVSQYISADDWIKLTKQKG